MNEEYTEFLRRLLIKIENAVNFLKNDPPRHILAYNKMLGVMQKLELVNGEHKEEMLLLARSSIQYFMNGRYKEAGNQIVTLKREVIQVYLYCQKENERNNNKKIC